MNPQAHLPGCLVCGQTLQLTSVHGRKSGKPFLMLRCPVDARHFRAFITDQAYVHQVMAKLEAQS